MNGASARRTEGLTALAGRALAVTLAVGLGGCGTPTTYDGTLASGFSRVTVDNRTSWRCEVDIHRTDVRLGMAPAGLKAVLDPGQAFRWDLGEGSYLLKATKLDGPVESYTKTWESKAGKELVWPLIELGDKSRASATP